MKTCCVCKESLVPPDLGYPQFGTDPKNPELICRKCLPAELIRSFQRQPKAVRDAVLKQFKSTTLLH